MCPGHNESAGKRHSGKTRKGSPWLRSVLIEAAHGAGRKKDCYLQAQLRRLASRRGNCLSCTMLYLAVAALIISGMLSSGVS